MSSEPAVGSPASDAAATLDRLCRNCGAAAPGAYCAACGQDTWERLPTLAQFTRDATGRYVALDGKLWETFAARLAAGFWVLAYLSWSVRAVYCGSWPGIAARGAALAAVHSVLFGFVTVGLLIAAVLLR